MRSADISIRDAGIDDAAAIAEMVHRIAVGTGDGDKAVSGAEDFRRHGFGEVPHYRALIAEQSGAPVGLSLWLYDFSSWRGNLGAYLQDLFVEPALRGSGLGKTLLAATCERAIADGACHLRLSVNSENQAARDFYSHLGFAWRDDECIYQIADEALAELARTRGSAA